LGQNFGKVVVDRCEPNFNTIWESHGAVVGKRNRVAIFSRLSTVYERDTGAQTDHRTVTLMIAIGEIAYQRCRLT